MSDAWTRSLLTLFWVCWAAMLCHSPFGTFRDSVVGRFVGWMSRKLLGRRGG